MDDADRARHLQQAANESAARQRRPVPSIEPVGYCHDCGELVDDPQLFCDGECAQSYERSRR